VAVGRRNDAVACALDDEHAHVAARDGLGERADE
jgi:hypothetical protein